MSKDAYYIKHDCNSRRDIKIMAMLSEYGMAGYGMYWTIVEIMREQNNYKLKKNKFLFAVLSKDLMCTPKESEKFIKSCIEDYDLLVDSEDYIYSESLLRRMEKLDELKAKRSAAGKWDRSKKEKNKPKDEDPFPIDDKPSKTDTLVEDFLKLFNDIKRQHKPSNFKPTETLTSPARKNLKIIKKNYTFQDIEIATNAMFKNQWAKESGNQTPTHLLVEKNFERYMEKGGTRVASTNKNNNPISYG